MIKFIKISLAIIFILLAVVFSIYGEYKARRCENAREERIKYLKENNLDEPIGIPEYFAGNYRRTGYGSAFFSLVISSVCFYSLKENRKIK